MLTIKSSCCVLQFNHQIKKKQNDLEILDLLLDMHTESLKSLILSTRAKHYNFLKLETLGADTNGMETGVINLNSGLMNSNKS